MIVASAYNVHFVRQQNQILSDVSFEIGAGQHWLLLGPNGSGKSSIIKILTGYEWPTSGSIGLDGRKPGDCSVRELRERVGLFEPALQGEAAVHYPLMSAEDVVVTGAIQAVALFDDVAEDTRRRARELLLSQGFAPERPFSVMSSGEQRRTLLLRALFAAPRLLILDEPYESLDLRARAELERVLETFAAGKEIPSTLTALHRIEEIPRFATHALLLKKGEVFKCGLLDQCVTSDSLSELYETGVHVSLQGGRYVCVLS